MAFAHYSANAYFHMSQNSFSDAVNTAQSNPASCAASTAAGLLILDKALQAMLTQISQDIATLKTEVASLKPGHTQPSGLMRSL